MVHLENLEEDTNLNHSDCEPNLMHHAEDETLLHQNVPSHDSVSRQYPLELLKRLPASLSKYTQSGSAWWLLCFLLGVGGYIRECHHQEQLTTQPLIFHQNDRHGLLHEIVRRIPSLTKEMKPTFLVGTWSVLNSVAAYLKLGPRRNKHDKGYDKSHFREIMTMPQDGAKIAVDWELPKETKFKLVDKQNVLHGPINTTVVLILHGINNDASFGYIKSAMRACTNRGWVAAGLNFRGCGGVDMATPRGYTAAYTGDLRVIVNVVASRTARNQSIFIVGNSLGANLIVKYLGEEGLSNTLPACVAGGVSLGNPLKIYSKSLKFPWGQLLGMGVKKTMLLNYNALSTMRKGSIAYRKAYQEILLANTVGEIDCIYAPFKIRNEPVYPYASKIGYASGEDYWSDAGSYQYIPHISVPLLQISAMDDFLVHHNALAKLGHCLSNPNVIVAKTKSGGHLGWNDATGLIDLLFGVSWADRATTEFIQAVLDMKQPHYQNKRVVLSLHNAPIGEFHHDNSKIISRL